MNCRLCGGDLRPWFEMPIDAVKDESTPFKNLVRCDVCGTGMVTPQPEAHEIGAFYQLPTYYTHGESHMRPVQPRFRDKVLTRLSWMVDYSTLFDPAALPKALPPGATVCDLGCGEGTLLKRSMELGFSATGVEPDPCSRELA